MLVSLLGKSLVQERAKEISENLIDLALYDKQGHRKHKDVSVDRLLSEYLSPKSQENTISNAASTSSSSTSTPHTGAENV